MIYYFSGTGNSKYIAQKLAKHLGDKVSAMHDFTPDILTGSVGFVFPVYAWGLPKPVRDFIERLSKVSKTNDLYLWSVMSCGDETGDAPKVLQSLLRKSGLEVSSIWSVIMPNVYVLLPGFDVDSKEIEQKKLSNAPQRIFNISKAIKKRLIVVDVVRGSWPRLKTQLVYPLFLKWGVFPNKFRVLNNCIGCGKCAKVCPIQNITLNDNRPKWGSSCSSCMACYHICPLNSINYGNATKNKGQYNGPKLD